MYPGQSEMAKAAMEKMMVNTPGMINTGRGLADAPSTPLVFDSLLGHINEEIACITQAHGRIYQSVCRLREPVPATESAANIAAVAGKGQTLEGELNIVLNRLQELRIGAQHIDQELSRLI